MKRSLILASVTASLVLGATSGYSGVNCEQVKKYLKTGRTPQDVADTMVISLDEVKKCQSEADTKSSTGGSTGTAGGASGTTGGTTAAPEGSKGH
jgi:hypothetical protein